MMRNALLIIFILLYTSFTWAQEHEYTDLKKIDLSRIEDYVYKKTTGRVRTIQKLPNFVLEDTTGEMKDFYKFIEGKKIVLLTFMRADCENSEYEYPNIENNYQKYKNKGFDVFTIMEYSDADHLEEFLMEQVPSGTVTLGTRTKQDEDIRFLTDHYRLRKSLGDKRKWGTPFSFLIKDGDLQGYMDRRQLSWSVWNGDPSSSLAMSSESYKERLALLRREGGDF